MEMNHKSTLHILPLGCGPLRMGVRKGQVRIKFWE